MRIATTTPIAIIALIAGNVALFAQDPPGSVQQDRGIREERGQPGTVGQGRDRIVPVPTERVTPPPVRPYGNPPEPPGGDWQDKGINEEAGKPPQGEKR
jgi:hypothetical protein